MSSDEHTHLDAAYVLGSLSPTERQEFEKHLDGCPACARSVREVAGLPGLLSRLDEHVVASLGDPEPVPASLLPGLLRKAERVHRRRRLLSFAAVAAAAAVLLVALAFSGRLGLAGYQPDQPQAGGTVSATRAMTPLGQTQLRADLSLQPVAWGTRMSVTCTYYGTSSGGYGPLNYALVVRNRAGQVEQVGTWRAVPGQAATFQAATAERPRDIASVEIRTTTGLPLLRLQQ